MTKSKNNYYQMHMHTYLPPFHTIIIKKRNVTCMLVSFRLFTRSYPWISSKKTINIFSILLNISYLFLNKKEKR